MSFSELFLMKTKAWRLSGTGFLVALSLLSLRSRAEAEEQDDFPIDLMLEESSSASRTPLAYMTMGFIGVQYAVVYKQRHDEEWVDEGHIFKDGFTHAPVWEDDAWHYNYLLHPWVGSEYYLVARNRGGSMMQSLAYSAALSTFYEYMAENLIQQPSINDLLITPLVGSLLGELRYSLKEKIRTNPSSVPGARYWIALLDPLDISIGGYPDGQMRLYLNWKHDF